MTKVKAFALFSTVLFLAILLLPNMVQPVKALGGDDLWYEYWSYNPSVQYDDPQNISSQTTIYSGDGDYWAKMALVVSIYEYNRFQGDNTVNFRSALYFDSFANEELPVAYPVAADFVTFFIDKDTGGSDLNQQMIRIIDFDAPGWGGGYSQGYGLDQSLQTQSDPYSRALWGLDAIAFGASLFFEPIGIAWDLISIATGWAPQPGSDYDNAETGESQALSWWHNSGYDFGTQNPIRQYAFNSIMWQQNEDINPSTFFGIKVSARVGLSWPNPFELHYIDLSPVYLRIYHYSPPPPPPGDGGCPYVSVWNGSAYVLDNNLIPAAEHSSGSDVIDYYRLQQPLTWENGKYSLLIWDLDKHSFLDEVKLLAVDHESDVNVAVSPYGEILTYKYPTPPTTTINKNGTNILDLVNAQDEQYYQGESGDYVELDFSSANIQKGAKLVITADACRWPPCEIKSPIYIQIFNPNETWQTVATIYPRFFWSKDIIDMSNHWPDANGQLKVRLVFTSIEKVDYVGLDTSKQGEFDLHQGNLATANHTRLGDVKALFQNSDNQYVELLPYEQVTVQFTLPQNTKQKRDYIIILEGHYFIH